MSSRGSKHVDHHRRYKSNIGETSYRVWRFNVHWLILTTAVAIGLGALIYVCVKFKQFCRAAGEDGVRMRSMAPAFQGVATSFNKSAVLAAEHNHARPSDAIVLNHAKQSASGHDIHRNNSYWRHRLTAYGNNQSLLRDFRKFKSRSDRTPNNTAVPTASQSQPTHHQTQPPPTSPSSTHQPSPVSSSHRSSHPNPVTSSRSPARFN